MKRILLALTMVGLLIPFGQRAQAEPEVSLDFFYDNLSPYGNWIDVGDYGYCFQPNVAVSSSDWRPYSDGYWAYTNVGWTWVSYEDFGWATYHYGRWSNPPITAGFGCPVTSGAGLGFVAHRRRLHRLGSVAASR
jgi:hypothetical protein